ncbi:MAG: hypothetical protein V1834_00515 [Candidatus Micrarchaeota archaeon]
MYRYVQKSFTQAASKRSEAFKSRLTAWRKQKTVQRAAKPTNPLRARALGYKAKKGFAIVRVKVKRGKRVRRSPVMGRKPGKNRKRENPGKSWQWFAEQKAWRGHRNMEIINSYWVGDDGSHSYYEVILRELNG